MIHTKQRLLLFSNKWYWRVDSRFRALGLVPFRTIEPASSTGNYGLLREWLQTCQSNHEACCPPSWDNPGSKTAQESSVLPSRVIDLGLMHDANRPPVLLQTNGMSGQYVCLSHRWGKAHVLRTEHSNVEEFQQGLPMAKMPTSFRDAMEVTRQLGFRYLWIDSLCIIQDDDDDWMRESKNMGNIFENSSFTIAAVDGLDPEGDDRGLFLPRNMDPLEIILALPHDKTPLAMLSRRVFKKRTPTYVWKYRWLEAPQNRNSGSGLDPNTISLRPRLVSLFLRIKRSEWYRRGWVLQERLLSRRIIYYTKEKLYWSCFTSTGEEEGGDPTCECRWRVPGAGGDQVNPLQVSSTWQTIVSDYVRCGLTYSKDRLVALRGVFGKIESLGIQIHAGILDDPTQPGNSLLWYTDQTPLLAFHDFHAPSWSWACLDGAVSFYMAEPQRECSFLVRNLRFETTNHHQRGNEGEDHGACGGTCVSGTVSCVGPVGKLSLGGKVKDMEVEGPDGKLRVAAHWQLLRLILGSALCHGLSIPRYDETGKRVTPGVGELLPVPLHTEVLVEEESGAFIGFLIPDHPVEDGERRCGMPIECLGVKHWGQSSLSQLTLASGLYSASEPDHGFWQGEEAVVDILGLEAVEGNPGQFRRLGRGRVVCNSWLSRCTDKMVIII